MNRDSVDQREISGDGRGSLAVAGEIHRLSVRIGRLVEYGVVDDMPSKRELFHNLDFQPEGHFEVSCGMFLVSEREV